MIVLPLPMKGAAIIETEWHEDSRGGLARLFCDHTLSSVLGRRKIVQINHSRTHTKGAIRGLHLQRQPYAEMKFICCLRGAVFDVLVDLRPESRASPIWHSEILDPDNARMIVIPEGCAHGFQVLEPDTELLYLHTAPYSPKHEEGVFYGDPEIGIEWPLEVTDISERDLNLPGIETTRQRSGFVVA